MVISRALKSRCRRYRVRLTTLSGNKRLESTLRNMCNRAARKRKPSMMGKGTKTDYKYKRRVNTENYRKTSNYPKNNRILTIGKRKYKIGVRVGTGGYGFIDKIVGKPLVVKGNRLGDTKAVLMNEINILEKLGKTCTKHLSCIHDWKLIRHRGDNEHYSWIIIDHLPGMPVSNRFGEHIMVKWSKNTDWILKQLLYGLQYIHKHNIAHLDIKGENVIINRTKKSIKYIDFGVSCFLKKCKPKSYMREWPAELRSNKIKNRKKWKAGDIYMLGEMLKYVLFGKTKNKKVNALIASMLKKDYRKRPTIDSLIKSYEDI